MPPTVRLVFVPAVPDATAVTPTFIPVTVKLPNEYSWLGLAFVTLSKLNASGVLSVLEMTLR